MNIIADSAIPFISQVFASSHNITLLKHQEMSRENLDDAEALIVRSATRVNAQLLDGTKVRIVATPTSGVDHIDRDYLQSANIQFINTPGCNARSVAEYVLSCLNALQQEKSIDLTEITVGIIGCGHVGSQFSSMLNIIGVKHLLYDPPLQDADDDGNYSLLREIQNADIISLHVPLTTEGRYPTYHLVDGDFLSRLKPDVVIVNTSRGEVIDENALLDFLDRNEESRVVLDVWENEPHINRQLLSTAIISTPHIAGYSIDAKYNGTMQVYENICELEGIDHNSPGSEIIPQLENNHLIAPEETDDNEVIQSVVLSGYDVRNDAEKFKQLIAGQEKYPGQYFSDFRKGYPVRREFTYYSVILPRSRAMCKQKLEGLGFKVSPED